MRAHAAAALAEAIGSECRSWSEYGGGVPVISIPVGTTSGRRSVKSRLHRRSLTTWPVPRSRAPCARDQLVFRIGGL